MYNFETLLEVQTVVYRVMFAGSYFEILTINPVSILTRPVPMTQRIMVNPKVAIRHRMTET